MAEALGGRLVTINERAVVVDGLDEQLRASRPGLACGGEGDDAVNGSLPAALRGQKLAVVDVEGNGQQPPEIIDIAVLPVHGEATAEHLRAWMIRPERPINPLVTRKVHGISDKDVAHCPPWSTVAAEVEQLLTGRTLIAHNASVELNVLSAHLPRWKPPMVLDTLRLAKRVLPNLAGGYGLDNLLRVAKVDTSGVTEQRRHRASHDTWCAWTLLLTLIEIGGLDWERLVQASLLRRPYARLPLGPFEGERRSLWVGEEPGHQVYRSSEAQEGAGRPDMAEPRR
ncbi:3'-5' exonuclease [Streptoalloteichus hindustanus]|uniref:DNA polymerase III, epsilon subunit n=1 Tax=Streptoalloteichus hindustanus TaxID=2017 RepID=A0A1M5DAX3_STRHI|nr:3'-5' exonuclease [Streptoalloteichus hindustanus]SHF64024.1 DNA polymerase III, epsilon subunit [Streptoalloteichus hindustanus]